MCKRAIPSIQYQYQCRDARVKLLQFGVAFFFQLLPRRRDTRAHHPRQLDRLGDERLKPLLVKITGRGDDPEPRARLGEFLHRDLHLMDEVPPRFRLLGFGVVRRDAGRTPKKLILEVTGLQPFRRDRFDFCPLV